MTAYEAGFAEGEREAFRDRHRMPRCRPEHITSPYGHGYWDGYLPRSTAWALRKPAAAPFHERDTEPA